MGVHFAINMDASGHKQPYDRLGRVHFWLTRCVKVECSMPQASLLLFSIMLMIASSSSVGLARRDGDTAPGESVPEARR